MAKNTTTTRAAAKPLKADGQSQAKPDKKLVVAAKAQPAAEAATESAIETATTAASATVVKPEAKKATGTPKAASKAGSKAEARTEAKSEAKEKVKKTKLVRDSFTMPEEEYAVLGEVKKTCLKAGIEVKKSELLRVGVALLRKLDASSLQEVLAGLPALKAGRPKKSK